MQLQNACIPKVGRDFELKQLRRLPVPLQCKLAMKWYKQFGINNNNHTTDRKNKYSVEQFESILEEFIVMKYNRRYVSSKLLTKFWPNGLNIFQLSQIDLYILLNHPLHYKWNSQVIYVSKFERIGTNSINIPKFIDNLYSKLTIHNMTYIFTKHHPTLPLQLFRIQLFDKSLNANNMEKLISRSPFYFALFDDKEIPMLIHSPLSNSDPFAKLILHSIKESMSSRFQLNFKPNELDPIKSLDNIILSCGASRMSESMGRWSAFSKDNADSSPLGDIIKHKSVHGFSLNDKDNIKLKSYLKFKGNNKFNDNNNDNDKYKSLIPIGKVSFTLIDSVSINTSMGNDINNGNNNNNNIQENTEEEEITIKFKFKGSDVFGGIHKLCDEGLIDIDKVPGWLAGENGPHSGSISKGHFLRKVKKLNGGLI